LGVTELREVRMLEEENARLKRVVADLTLDRHNLQRGTARKSLKPPRRHELARWIREHFGLACNRVSAGDVATLDLVSAQPCQGSDVAAHAYSRTRPQSPAL